MKAVAGATGPAILSACMFFCHSGQVAGSKSSGPVGTGEFLCGAGERRYNLFRASIFVPFATQWKSKHQRTV